MLDLGGIVFSNSPPAIYPQTHAAHVVFLVAVVRLYASSSRTNPNPFAVAEGEKRGKSAQKVRGRTCLCFSLIDFALMFLAVADRVRPERGKLESC